MKDKRIVLLDTKNNKIFQYFVLLLLLLYLCFYFRSEGFSLWFWIIIIILLAGFLELNYTTSNYIYFDSEQLILEFSFINVRTIKFNLIEIREIFIHRSSGRLDRNFLLLKFDLTKEKRIYFSGNDSEYKILFDELVKRGIRVHEME